jgi:hypothetical protein
MATNRLQPLRALLACFSVAVLFLTLALPGSANAQSLGGFIVGLKGHDFAARPGETVTGSISITNNGAIDVDVRFSTSDEVRDPSDPGNPLKYADLGTEPRSLAGWLAYDKSDISVPKGVRKQLEYSIMVPNDAKLNGTYWGIIFIEKAEDDQDIQDIINPEQKTTIQVKTKFRFAVRVTLTITGTETRGGKIKSMSAGTMTRMMPDPKEPPIKLDPTKSVDDQPKPKMIATPILSVKAVFENTGNIIERPKIWAELLDTTGKQVKRTDLPFSGGTMPESVCEYEVDVPASDVPDGEYLLRLVADYGGEKLVAGQARINLSQAAIPPLPDPGPAPDAPPGSQQ